MLVGNGRSICLIIIVIEAWFWQTILAIHLLRSVLVHLSSWLACRLSTCLNLSAIHICFRLSVCIWIILKSDVFIHVVGHLCVCDAAILVFLENELLPLILKFCVVSRWLFHRRAPSVVWIIFSHLGFGFISICCSYFLQSLNLISHCVAYFKNVKVKFTKTSWWLTWFYHFWWSDMVCLYIQFKFLWFCCMIFFESSSSIQKMTKKLFYFFMKNYFKFIEDKKVQK